MLFVMFSSKMALHMLFMFVKISHFSQSQQDQQVIEVRLGLHKITRFN